MLETRAANTHLEESRMADHEDERSHNQPQTATETTECHDTPHRTSDRTPQFFRLPVEVRLNIYIQLLLLNPLPEARWSIYGYPDPRPEFYVTKPLIIKTLVPSATDESGNSLRLSSSNHTQPRLLPPRRPIGFIPSAVLRTCKQIYIEARTAPFYENEFVFIFNLCSVLPGAQEFVAGLENWQHDAMRFFRLEIFAENLYMYEYRRCWEKMCALWAIGLRGLRLSIDSTRDVDSQRPGRMVWEDARLGGKKQWRWIDRGLRKLTRLKVLEVELVGEEFDDLGDEGKVRWCKSLSGRLNEGRRDEDKTVVVCVEKVRG